ncbi:hypothetical protein PRUPE_1G131000 [Prunus persica]|uniref:Uncharacterized protein n=1 Tax=Prunus persica TaxID=3760 RepID=A0A251QZL7_PRUPE|nr:hypothetical protein PRUPE_1G131000 [Prunus persica]
MRLLSWNFHRLYRPSDLTMRRRNMILIHVGVWIILYLLRRRKRPYGDSLGGPAAMVLVSHGRCWEV